MPASAPFIITLGLIIVVLYQVLVIDTQKEMIDSFENVIYKLTKERDELKEGK